MYNSRISKGAKTPNFYSPVAQLVEQLAVNQLVRGSSPRGGAKFDDQPKLKSSGLINTQTPQVLIGLWGYVLRRYMKILDNIITNDKLKKIAQVSFGDLVKAVVDVDRELVAIDAELHSDLEALFLENGSKQNSLWGINFYPDLEGEEFIEFDSMINLRPSQGNMTRGVDSKDIQAKILNVVNKWVK